MDNYAIITGHCKGPNPVVVKVDIVNKLDTNTVLCYLQFTDDFYTIPYEHTFVFYDIESVTCSIKTTWPNVIINNYLVR